MPRAEGPFITFTPGRDACGSFDSREVEVTVHESRIVSIWIGGEDEATARLHVDGGKTHVVSREDALKIRDHLTGPDYRV